MTHARHPDIGYLSGLITETGTIVVVAGSEKLEEEDVPHSFLAVWAAKDRKWTIFEEDFYITSVTATPGQSKRTLVSLGMYGEAIVNEPSGLHRERLAKGKDAPNNLRTMHDVRRIGSHFYAVGMRRQVFRRNVARGPWTKIDSGVFVPDNSKEIAGFLSIDGFDDTEVYAVGYSGEIWLFDGKSWAQLSSPTNARLECVRCQLNGSVQICGASGVVLNGRRDDWQELDQDLTDEPLLSLAMLGQKTYFATDEGVIIEYDGKAFKATRLPPKTPMTTGVLDTNGEDLLSIGDADIATYNGKAWTMLPHPAIDPD